MLIHRITAQWAVTPPIDSLVSSPLFPPSSQTKHAVYKASRDSDFQLQHNVKISLVLTGIYIILLYYIFKLHTKQG